MTKAVTSGMPKLRIEAAATRKQARIDRGEETIVGVNKYRPETPDTVEVLDIDNTEVRRNQIRRLEKIKANRDAQAVKKALTALTDAARSGEGNLLALSIEAARQRATVGEISDAMEKVYGRHRAEIKSVSGVYAKAYEGDEGFASLEEVRDNLEAILRGWLRVWDLRLAVIAQVPSVVSPEHNDGVLIHAE